MSRCEGLPDGPCPNARNDQTVRLTQGDLMLYRTCEEYRFPYLRDAGRPTKAGVQELSNSRNTGIKTLVPDSYSEVNPANFQRRQL